MIDILSHRQILLNILNDFYRNPKIMSQLGFKGGTCLYFFYELPRFSTDLDFNLVGNKNAFDPSLIRNILKNYLDLDDFFEKQETWLWEGSYKKGHHHIKIEISKRDYPDQYVVNNLYGLSVRCMELSCQFAHKLCAITDRKILANRDLFDALFLFKKSAPIDENIIQIRTRLPLKKYLGKLADYIPKHISKRGILDGLGEVLDDTQKQWVKKHLVDELIFMLKSRQ